MSQIINEILLRLSKLVLAGIIATILYILAVGGGGVTPSFELVLMCWISASVALLMLESSPI